MNIPIPCRNIRKKSLVPFACLAILLSLTLTLSAVELAKDVTIFLIEGTENVVDGWIRTDGEASFAGVRLQAHGRAWSSYDHALVRFDLSSVDATRFGRVRKAVLRLHVLAVKNLLKKELVVAPSRIPWDAAATASSPVGDDSTWPVRESHANISYAMIDSLKSQQVIEQPGWVEFDITETVERWLFQGLRNDGLLVTASPAVFGRPNHGSWTLEFSASEAVGDPGPALLIEMEGQPPRPARAQERALALYPSALLAPVRDPYYFVFYNVGERHLWRQLRTINMTTYDSHASWLAPRGVMNLSWAEGGPTGWLPDETAYVNYYTTIAKENAVGFCGHESNLQGDQLDWLVRAFREAEQKWPECFSAYYYRGESRMAAAAGHGYLDLLIQEGYTSTHKQFPLRGFAIGLAGIKQRIAVAREHGAIDRQIVMLGHICQHEDYHPGHELTPESLDQLMGELRRYAPEMPGIGFYGAGGKALAIECDRLAHKHFVEPAPELLITQPVFEQTLSAPHVTIRAEAEAKDDRQVTGYRWFIDNRLVAETPEPHFVWDLRGEQPGLHFITVHAIDNAWNRSATQIVVRVDQIAW